MAITMDRITIRAKAIIPVTWDALTSAKQVDDSVLVGPIEYAEAFYLEEIPTAEEQNAMSPLVIEFIAKTAVLNMIGPAIDFWMEQAESVVTTGTNETTSYPDRIKALENLKKSLLEELAKLEPVVSPLLPVVQTRRGGSAPRMSSINDELLTPNPQDFGPIYAEKVA